MRDVFGAFRAFTLGAQVASIPDLGQVPTAPPGCRNKSSSINRNPIDRFVGAPSVRII